MNLSKNKLRFLGVLLLPIAIGLSGCGGSDDEGGGVEATYSSLWDNELQYCGTNCHNSSAADGTENGPDMSTKSHFYSNVVGKSAGTDFPGWIRGGDCDSTPFIDPSNANNSTVIASLDQNYSDNLTAGQNCTTSYNLHVANNVEPGSNDIKTALIQWINDGANND